MFVKIKEFYEKNLWHEKEVLQAVSKEKITLEQANEILKGE